MDIVDCGSGGPKSTDWTTFLCAQSEQAHRSWPSTSSRPSFSAIFGQPKPAPTHVTSAAAERNWLAWAHTYSFVQPAEQRNSRELVYTKAFNHYLRPPPKAVICHQAFKHYLHSPSTAFVWHQAISIRHSSITCIHHQQQSFAIRHPCTMEHSYPPSGIHPSIHPSLGVHRVAPSLWTSFKSKHPHAVQPGALTIMGCMYTAKAAFPGSGIPVVAPMSKEKGGRGGGQTRKERLRHRCLTRQPKGAHFCEHISMVKHDCLLSAVILFARFTSGLLLHFTTRQALIDSLCWLLVKARPLSLFGEALASLLIGRPFVYARSWTWHAWLRSEQVAEGGKGTPVWT
eukprot:1141518-Pelagomonas_calceolata.AAC.1